MSDHRWAVVAVSEVDDRVAARIHAMDLMDRIDDLDTVLRSGRIDTVRGPICMECRVHYRDVHHNPDKPWPCPGARPAELGGPLVAPENRLSRQERRAKQRQALKLVKS